jgi:ABC-type branched-subunit amino acid transport system substrate-binding protein
VSGGRSSGPVAAPQGAPATGPASAAASTVAGLGVSSSVCNGPAAGPGVSPSEVDVGTVTTLTGPVPGLFAGAVRGINAFAAYLNSVGGVCGRKLVVKAADDNLQASQNATAAQSLVNSVLAFVGSLSGVDEGGAPVLQSSGVPDVGEALSTQRFNLSNNFSPMPQGISVDLAPWVYFKQKYPQVVTHMAVLSVNQATDLAETQAAVQGLESIGYKFVYTDYNVELDQTDFSADAQAMKAAGAQGLVFIAIASLYALVAKAMQNAGLHMALPDYDQNAYDPNFIPDAGSAADGAILWSEVALYQGEDAASVPTIALFDKWYKAVSGGGSPDLYAAWGWMSGMLFVAGLNAGAGLSRTALMDGLRTVTSFDAGGIESPADPPTKRPPDCYLVVDVVNQRFVRDPVNPTSGFDCTGAPNHYFPH